MITENAKSEGGIACRRKSSSKRYKSMPVWNLQRCGNLVFVYLIQALALRDGPLESCHGGGVGGDGNFCMHEFLLLHLLCRIFFLRLLECSFWHLQKLPSLFSSNDFFCSRPFRPLGHTCRMGTLLWVVPFDTSCSLQGFQQGSYTDPLKLHNFTLAIFSSFTMTEH